MATLEYVFNAGDLVSPLRYVTSIVSPKSIIPILDNVLIKFKDNVIIVRASDNETWLNVKAPLVENKSNTDTAICVSAKDFTKSISVLGDRQVTMCIDTDKKKITCKHGSGRFSMPYDDAADFPNPKETADGNCFTIGADKLCEAINATSYAIANDELRPILNGIYFDFKDDGMCCVATDGQKLVRYKDVGINPQFSNSEMPKSFTLHRKPLSALMPIISNWSGDISVMFNDRCVTIGSDSFRMDARLIEGKNPNYYAVIPQTHSKVSRFDANELISAIQRVMTMGNVTTMLVVLTFDNGEITISAEDYDFSRSAVDTVKYDFYSGEPIKIGFKGSSLCEVLKNARSTEKMIVEMTEQKNAAVFYADDGGARDTYLSLLMPMLIN